MNEGTTALFFLDHWERTQPSSTQTARLASCFFWKSSFYLVSLQQQTDVLLRDLGLGKTPYIFGRKSWLPFPDHCFQNLPAMLRGSISHHHKRKLCYLCTFSQSPWWAMITCERRVQSHKLRGHWKFRLSSLCKDCLFAGQTTHRAVTLKMLIKRNESKENQWRSEYQKQYPISNVQVNKQAWRTLHRGNEGLYREG